MFLLRYMLDFKMYTRKPLKSNEEIRKFMWMTVGCMLLVIPVTILVSPILVHLFWPAFYIAWIVEGLLSFLLTLTTIKLAGWYLFGWLIAGRQYSE